MDEINALKTKLDSILSMLQYTQHGLHPPMLNLLQASTYLGITKSTLYKHTSAGNITYYKPNGKLILFKKEDLDYWIKAKRIPSVCEINQEQGLKRA